MMLNTIELRTIGVEGNSHSETENRPEVLPLSKKHTSWFQGGIDRRACPLTTLLIATARCPNMESLVHEMVSFGLITNALCGTAGSHHAVEDTRT